MVTLSLEDFGTLLVCATRYGQANDCHTKEIVELAKRHINKQSLKTLNVCLRDQKFFAWIIDSVADNNIWNQWYSSVRVAKKQLVLRYIKETGVAINRVYKCFNIYTFFNYLEKICGVNTDFSSEEISRYIDEHHEFNSMDIVLERVGARDMQQYINDYIDYAIATNGDDQRYFSQAFEEWAWKYNDENYKVLNSDFSRMSLYALRYCMGRETYMPSLVRDNIVTPHLSNINSMTLKEMLNDTERQKADNRYGDERCDKPGWIAWVTTLQREQQRRTRK